MDRLNKHKHKEIIQAWLNGEQIQQKINGEWFDRIDDISGSTFWEEVEYRIKPQKEFRTGNIFTIFHRYIHDERRDDYVLAQVSCGKFVLIGLTSGNRFSEPVDIKTTDNYILLEEDFLKLFGSPEYLEDYDYEYRGVYDFDSASVESAK